MAERRAGEVQKQIVNDSASSTLSLLLIQTFLWLISLLQPAPAKKWPEFAEEASSAWRYAAEQVSDKLGTMVGADNLPITVRGLQSLLPRQAAGLLGRTSLIDQKRDHPE